MNKHLEPIFNIFISGLEEAGIDYWVYGGVAVAALAGKFIRKNRDIDIFVKETDLDNARSILESRCYDQDLVWNECRPLERDGFSRPKLEVRKGRTELLSIVPIYLKDNQAVLVFGNGIKAFSKDILNREEKSISGYQFYTPPDAHIREIFLNCFRHKRGWKERSDIKTDARVVLSMGDFEKHFS
jgi:hypothetical protein